MVITIPKEGKPTVVVSIQRHPGIVLGIKKAHSFGLNIFLIFLTICIWKK